MVKRKRGRPRKTEGEKKEVSSEVNHLQGLRLAKENEKLSSKAAKTVSKL
jgi:hypothetical protein